MRSLGALATFAACAIATFTLSGCSVQAGVEATTSPPEAGTIAVLISIDGSTSPSQCDFYGVSEIELAVFDAESRVAIVNAPCEDFEVAVALSEGLYDAEATLLDDRGDAISSTLPLDNLRVVAGTQLQVVADFPSSDIY